ncbi:hypothetical protein CDL12_19458 [Handroanthus impetiginosus]|uniref:Uncharacterized protein n=1 Tax=Handroanthus impetiginosus TaxID=429701 RepID=A0A2G9GRX8_9LAMI|nr:hypothetical protein CDL12_19458 [Handroanthus impetiginosus]
MTSSYRHSLLIRTTESRCLFLRKLNYDNLRKLIAYSDTTFVLPFGEFNFLLPLCQIRYAELVYTLSINCFDNFKISK